MTKLYSHYSQFQGEWLWKNFTPTELACKHCGEYYHDLDALDALQLLRDGWGKPIVINSAHRCIKHNSSVGGSANSQHLKIAFDCVCARANQDQFVNAAIIAGFTGIGRYASRNFVHLDTGPKRGWRG